MPSMDRSISRREVLLGMSALPCAIAAAAESPSSTAAGLNLRPLRARFKGDLIVQADPRYENARLTNNRAFDHHPALIAQCLDADDVARSLDFARTNALPLAIRSGGHCQAGRSSCDAGVVIDLSRMDAIAIDGSNGRVSCGAGVRAYQANQAAVSYGLALPLGICGDVGVAGLTLGGGYGYLLGVAGLACDSLIGAQVVLADGHIQNVTEESDPDLLWALRGAGANFGVVTRLQFRAHRVTEIFGGTLQFPAAAARDVAALANDCAAGLPDELTMFTSILAIPGKGSLAQISLCWSGDVSHGREAVDKMLGPIKPSVDRLKVMTIAELVGRGAGTDGMSCVRYGDVAGKLPPAGLSALLDPGTPLPMGRDIAIDALHGAATRRKKSASAAPNYSPGFGVGYLVFWNDAGMTKAATEWIDAAWAGVHPYTQAAYVNMLGDESEERVREAYGDNYARAAHLKKKYDPENVFRLNQNIKPA